ncbi:hypothetical protein NL676_038702 [Syzygium grande]|nr:hypothetical protein NL676_038702 [Syzygium grande]
METELLYDLSPFVRIYKDGRVERFVGTEIIPPSLDEKTGIQSKDVAISSDSTASVRLYIPKAAIDSLQKLPVLVYFHGGGFIIETARSPTYHVYLNALVAEANIIAVSVDYRRAPEHPLPVASTISGLPSNGWPPILPETPRGVVEFSCQSQEGMSTKQGGDEDHVPQPRSVNRCVPLAGAVLRSPFLSRENSPHSAWRPMPISIVYVATASQVFLAGDSAGANIVHNMGIRLGEETLQGIEFPGVMMVHPYFWGNEPLPSETTEPEREVRGREPLARGKPDDHRV